MFGVQKKTLDRCDISNFRVWIQLQLRIKSYARLIQKNPATKLGDLALPFVVVWCVSAAYDSELGGSMLYGEGNQVPLLPQPHLVHRFREG